MADNALATMTILHAGHTGLCLSGDGVKYMRGLTVEPWEKLQEIRHDKG